MNGDVRGAGRLAGRGAALHNVGAVRAVFDVVAGTVPGDCAVGVISIGDVRVRRAVFLTEAERVRLAVLNALPAGDALFLVDTRGIVGAYGVLGAEVLRDAQRKARAAAAVAYCGGVLKAGGLVYLVDKTVVLGALEYLICLLLGDEAMRAGLGIVDGVVVEVHAHVLFQMAAAFAHEAARAAAGAGTDGDRCGVFNEGGYLVVGCRAGVVLDRTHDGHNAHEHHAELAGAERRGDELNTAAGVLFEAVAQIGVAVTLLAVGEYALHDAGDPDGVVVAKHAVRGARARKADLDELVDLLLHKVHVRAAAPRKLRRGARRFQTHMHCHAAHIVRDNGRKDPVLGVIVGNARVRHALKTYLRRESQNIRSFFHLYTSFLVINKTITMLLTL